MRIGNKKIYHLEAWVVKVMNLYKVCLFFLLIDEAANKFISTFSTTLIWTIWIDLAIAVAQGGVMHDQVIVWGPSSTIVIPLQIRRSASGNVDLVPEKVCWTSVIGSKYFCTSWEVHVHLHCDTLYQNNRVHILPFDFNWIYLECEAGWAEQLYFVHYRRLWPSTALQIYEYHHVFCRHTPYGRALFGPSSS